jgi:hypothetical protein
MTVWPKHALALFVLAALSFGLYGRLYSPLDHAHPEGEAASAAVTRFISENPDPWGWNPTWHGGQPTQLTALPAFHYAAAFIAWLGNEPLYAHRIVAATMALLAPCAFYFMLVTFDMRWQFALAAGLSVAVLSPFDLFFAPPLIFLPSRLAFLEWTGRGPFVAGLTLIPVALALLWRAGHNRRPISLFLAAVSLALVALTDADATLFLILAVGALELTMLGVAGEYRFSHRRVLTACLWAYLLCCFWLTRSGMPALMNWSLPFSLAPLILGAIAIRLGFLGRRDPLLAFSVLLVWAIGYVSILNVSEHSWTLLEAICVISVWAWAGKGLSHQRLIYQGAGALLILALLFLRFDAPRRLAALSFPSNAHSSAFGELLGLFPQRTSIFTFQRLKQQADGWRGDWGMRAPSASDEFKVTRWFVENPPRGRIFIEPSLPLAYRLNAWVRFPQAGAPGERSRDQQQHGVEYAVQRLTAEDKSPVVFKADTYAVTRRPFQSLAMSIKGDREGPPLELTWRTASELQITGSLPKDHLIRVSVPHHPGWRSAQVSVSPDAHGLISLAPPAGPIDIALEFTGTREQHNYGYVCAFAWLGSIGYVLYRSLRR